MTAVRAAGVLLALLLPAAAQAAQATLAVGTTSGSPPLATTFDTSATQLDSGQTAALHLVFPGNGDALVVTTPTPLTYTYALSGFYLADSVLAESPSGQLALATPVGVSVARVSDGQSPPAVDVVLARTTDPLTLAFMPDVTAAAGDPEVARRWDFGDGSFSGAATPLHAYAHPGLYQAALLSTSRSGMTAAARLLVAVNAADGSPAPSLLVAVTPPDSPPLTQVQLVAYIAAAAAPSVVSAHVDWPGLVDAAPAVTTEATGVVVRSSYAFAASGRYDVPITVALAGQTLTATGHVTVGEPSVNIAGVDAPSPSLLAAPSTTATVGQAYEPDGAGATLHALLVGGDGPFAFGVVAPSPAGFVIDSAGNVAWTPSANESGDQRIAIDITDINGQTLTTSWVVTVADAAKHGGCSALPGAASAHETIVYALFSLLALALQRRLRRRQ